MTKVIIGEDCGNSPKNIFVQELTIAFAKGDSKFILSKVTDDVRWNIVGDRVIEGKEDLAEALEKSKKKKVAQLNIRHIATHGKAGAVDGTLKFKPGKNRAFCDVYEFSNTKGNSVKEIISYVIEID
jgi:hypothetical protein